MQLREAHNRTFSNYTLHEIVVKEITIEYASAPFRTRSKLDLLQYQFRQILDAHVRDTHTHTHAYILDGIRDRVDLDRVIRDEFFSGVGGRANRVVIQARHEFVFSRSSKYKRVQRLSACLPSSVMPRFDATRVHFIYITTAV